MEIELKENSTLTVKNHSGTTLCSIDEATGAISGTGTKLYKHRLVDSDGVGIAIISSSPTIITQDNFMSELHNALQGVAEYSSDGGTNWFLPTADGASWRINNNLLYSQGGGLPFGAGFPIVSDTVTAL